MNEEKWPFNPEHITNDGPSARPDEVESLKFSSLPPEYLQTIRERRENLKKLTGLGIITNAYLEGLQTTICANLGNPTTIIEFSPEGDPVRTDSRLLYNAMHEPCTLFRNGTNEQVCLECDNCYAKLFYKLRRDELLEKVQERLNNCSCCFISVNIKKGLHCIIVPDTRRPYLEYDCSLLGYRELVFPIFFEEKVIAVFFVGQLCPRKRKDEILKQQIEFFEKPCMKFLECCPDENTRIELAKNVKDAHCRWVGNEKNIIEDKDYKDFISKIISELEGLEKKLDQQVDIKRDQYIRFNNDIIIKQFGDKLQVKPMSGEETWELLWKNTDERLERIVEKFSLQYISIFANRSFETQSSMLLDLVSKSKKFSEKLNIDSEKFKYDLTKISPDIRHKLTTSIEEPSLFQGLNANSKIINETRSLIRIFPVPFFPDATLIVLVGYMEELSLGSIADKPYRQLSDASLTFYALILSTLSATLAYIAEERRQKALGKIAHELRIPITAIQGATESIIETPGSKTFFDQDYPGDIWSWTELMTRVLENADVYRYIHKGELEIRPEKVFLLTNVIASAIRQVKLLLRKRNFPQRNITYIGFEKFPDLWLDRNRFQQVIFNLLSNSIKYAYDDPENFEVEIEGIEKGEYFYIYVRDWGTGIKPTEIEKVFEEEFRSEKAINMDVAGQGLGLWIVRQIIEKHCGEVRVSQVFSPTEFEIKLPYWLTSRSPIKKSI